MQNRHCLVFPEIRPGTVALLAICVLMLSACSGRGKDETVIYTAERFITMEADQPQARAVAVRDGRFIAVGSLENVRKVAGENARLDRSLDGRVVLPGFIEQHVHPVLAAASMNSRVISIEDWETMHGFSPAVRDARGYRDRLVRALAEHGDNDRPFVSWGYHHYFHGEMSRQLLDELAPDIPVLIWHRSQHEFFLNSRGLELAGIDQSVVDAASASQRPYMDLEGGHFYEQGIEPLFEHLIPILLEPVSFRQGLKFTVDYYHRSGITLACEPGGLASRPIQLIVNSVYSKDGTPFNHCFIPDGRLLSRQYPDDADALLAATQDMTSWGSGRTFFLSQQVKLFADGAIYSQKMQMRDGYEDGHEGAWIMSPDLFSYAFQAYWDAGYQLHVHNNGDAGLDVVLENLERAMARKPRDDHRTVLVHFGFAQAEQVARWGELGGIVSANPYYVTNLATHYASHGIGPERAAHMVPLGEVMDNGIPMSFHSDMPMASAEPLLLVWAAVNRLTAEGEVVGPEHRVPLDAALRAVTLDAAHSLRLEDRVGSIRAGKDANLTVLAADPYQVPPEQLSSIPVWGTMLEGRLQPVAPRGD